MQHGNLDDPDHYYVGAGQHSDTLEHPDGHSADCCPQLGMELLPIQQQAYQEEQQARTHFW
jgi:hypothetical protein